ncbi:MAG: ABC transporter, permease protein (cluster 3, basic aa/glutamine/opines), partial [uncultured Nocardioidaceae bacterium]
DRPVRPAGDPAAATGGRRLDGPDRAAGARLGADPLPAQGRSGLGGLVRPGRGAVLALAVRHRLDARQRRVHPRRRALHPDDRGRRHRPGDRAGALRCPREALQQLGRLRGRRVLRVVLPRHPSDRPDVPALPRPAADRQQPRRPLPQPRHQRRAAADPRRRGRRHPGAGTQLRRLHDRDLPRGDPVRRAGTGRGRRRPRHALLGQDAPGRAAAGAARHHPAHRQRVHRDAEGHRPRLLPGGGGRHRRDLPPQPARGKGRLQEPGGLRPRGRSLLGADGAPHRRAAPAGDPARHRVRPRVRRHPAHQPRGARM